MVKEKFTVSWIMAEEALLKLKEPDECYDIAEDVYKFIKDNKIYEREDFQVEVVINKEEVGENGNGIITSFKEVGGTNGSATEAPKEAKEEPDQTDNTSSPTPSGDLIVKELIVNGVSVAKKSVKFTVDKDNDTWYNLDESINAQEFKDKCTRKTLEVSISPADQGNDIIVGYTIKEEEKTDTPKDEGKKGQEPRKNNGNMMQKSIEAQASMNSACRVAQAILTKDSLPEDAEKIIKRISSYNFQMIQDLKNKE